MGESDFGPLGAPWPVDTPGGRYYAEIDDEAPVIVSNTLRGFYAIAERGSVEQRWTLLLTHIFRHWLGGKWLATFPAEANLLLSG
jgi:hypothetical protein